MTAPSAVLLTLFMLPSSEVFAGEVTALCIVVMVLVSLLLVAVVGDCVTVTVFKMVHIC